MILASIDVEHPCENVPPKKRFMLLFLPRRLGYNSAACLIRCQVPCRLSLKNPHSRLRSPRTKECNFDGMINADYPAVSLAGKKRQNLLEIYVPA